ncbi:MAG: hypothetical protein JSR99_17010 [Proteobacteria bacterium]|nr:hypothetical protein [Pseudomonadota bacterium]
MTIIDVDQEALPSETRVYRYLSIEGFDRFCNFGVSLTRISIWPDRLEASDFAFFVNAERFGDLRSKTNFFASCWTLEREHPAHFDCHDSYRLAQEELERDGSGSMWEAYCGQGGVRICTTLGKLDQALIKRLSKTENIYRGRVRYLASDDPRRVVGKNQLEEVLFYKRIGYRHEAEYRYVLHNSEEQSDYITAPIDDYYLFLDEILVFPLKDERTDAIANDLHSKGVSIATGPMIGTNMKDHRHFCRVSKLYGLASQRIGRVCFLTINK